MLSFFHRHQRLVRFSVPILTASVLFLLLRPHQAHAAVTFDSTVVSGNLGGSPNGNVTDTVVTLSNTVLFICIDQDASSPVNITSIKVNGTTATFDISTTSSRARVDAYHFTATTTGANFIAITGSGSFTNAAIGVQAFTGVASVDASTTKKYTSGTTWTDAIVSISDNALPIDCIHVHDGASHTNAQSGTQTAEFSANLTTALYFNGSWDNPVTPAGSHNMGWTCALCTGVDAVIHTMWAAAPAASVASGAVAVKVPDIIYF